MSELSVGKITIGEVDKDGDIEVSFPCLEVEGAYQYIDKDEATKIALHLMCEFGITRLPTESNEND